MEPPRERRLDLADKRIFALLIAVLLLSIGVVGYVAATSSSFESEELPVVEVGDLVYVNYVGFFSPNPGGWVFDTNDIRVAKDINIQKSLYFVLRDDQEYRFLNFTAGQSEQFLRPFVDAVVGMKVTQSKTILVPADQAYPVWPENIVTFKLFQEAPMIETFSASDFRRLHLIEPDVGLRFQHYFWEWDSEVLSVDGDNVVIENLPWIGQIVSQYGDPDVDARHGWYSRVVSVDYSANSGQGVITVQNLISPQDAYKKRGTDYDRRTFTLISVDETDETFTVHYNGPNYVGELAGRDLYFQITVMRVLRS